MYDLLRLASLFPVALLFRLLHDNDRFRLVAARGFATFEELLDPELLDDLEALGPYGLLDVPRKKLAQRRQWWSRGEESLSPDIGPAMAALGLT